MEYTRNLLESQVDVKDIIVIDNGTSSLKIGYSGENMPRLNIDSVAGSVLKKDDQEQISNKTQHLFGPELYQAIKEQKLDIKLNYPINRGKIEAFNEFNKNLEQKEKLKEQIKDLWEYALEEKLQISELQNCNLLIVDSVTNSKEYKQKMAETLFEEMKVQSVVFMNSATLSLLSTGETTGLVIESGEGITSVVPIYESYPIYHAIQTSNIAGQDITSYIHQKLKSNTKYDFDNDNINTLQLVKQIKEKMCVVINEDGQQIHNSNSQDETSYELPDGQVIQIDNDIKYNAPEIIFNPALIQSSEKSLTQMMQDSYDRCDLELQNDFYNAIAISGGNTMIRGFTERIKNEFFQMVPESMNPRDIEFRYDSQRLNAAWIGGSMLGSLSTFQNLAITRVEYDEDPLGKTNIVQKRTF